MLRLLPLFAMVLAVSAYGIDSDRATPEAEVWTLTKLTNAPTEFGAMCLDGSPPAYYTVPGSGSGASKWMIFHQGGGWCGSDTNCYDRAQNRLGSSKSYTPTESWDTGYYSSDPEQNPLMYNWNKVYLMYCDGGSFGSYIEEPKVINNTKIWYRGIRNLEAIRSSLMEKGLKNATDVVIAGCSAGGVAAYLHVDWWADSFTSATKVRGMPDSGFFLQVQGKRGFISFQKWVFENMNIAGVSSKECLAAHVGEEYYCMFSQNIAPFIKTPIFALQSQYDHYQIGPGILKTTNVTLINEYGAMLKSIIDKAFVNKESAMFLDSCVHHCGNEFDVITIDGLTQGQAFKAFYEGSNKRYYADKVYPCTECCKKPNN